MVAAELRGCSVDLGGVEVLSEVDLAVPSGSIVGIRGENGSGKSTMLRVLAGLVFPKSGSATVFGEPPTSAAVRLRIGAAIDTPVEAAHLTDFGGGGIDYTLSYQSGYHQRGLHSVVAIALLVAATVLLSWLGLVLLGRQRAGAGRRIPYLGKGGNRARAHRHR